eukprot:gene2435-215_t
MGSAATLAVGQSKRSRVAAGMASTVRRDASRPKRRKLKRWLSEHYSFLPHGTSFAAPVEVTLLKRPHASLE